MKPKKTLHFFLLIATAILFCPLAGSLAQTTVYGFVRDARTAKPLPFAAIKTGDKGQGVVADLDGRFTVSVPEGIDIEIHYLGYETLKQRISHTKDTLYLELVPAFNVINEVVIRPPREKIRRILNNAISHRDEHNPELYDWYRCHVYYKMLADAILPDTLLQHDSAREIRNFLESQHLLMSETYSIRTWKRPQKLQEEILGSRVSGFKKSLFNGLVTDMLPFHAYSDYLVLNGKEYHNPISKGYGLRYQFALEDELLQGNDTTWLLSFKPKKGMSGLRGKVYISSDGYPITHLIATAYDSNLVREVRLEQQYTKVGDRWFPNQLNYIFNWQVKSEKAFATVQMQGTSRIDSVSFDELRRFRFDKVHTVKLKAGADELDDTAWMKLRPAPLSGREQQTYTVMDTLIGNTGVAQILPYVDKLMQLKVPYKFLDFDLKRLVRNNSFENFRLGLGAQTNEKWLRWLSIGGWAGYGLRDTKWKYGGFAEFYLDPYKESVLSLRYDHDLRDPGRLELHPELNKNYLRAWLMQRADQITTYSAAIKQQLGYWQFGLEGKYETITPQYHYELQDVAGAGYNTFNATEASLSVRYAYAERSAPFLSRYYRTGTRYPILYGRISAGQLESGNYNTNYLQLLGAVSWQKHINRLGNERLLVMGGKSWSDRTLPISKLFSGNGIRRNDDYNLYSFGALVTATPYALYSDAFAALYWKHDFDWHFYSYNPANRSLGSVPSLSLAHNVMYGTMNDRQAQQLVLFDVPDKAYHESGVMINDILRVKYVDLYYLTINAGYFYHWTNTGWNKKNGSVVFGLGVAL